MQKTITSLLLFLVIIFSNSCKKTYETVPGNVVINELMPVNTTTVADQDGEYDDWIEIFNLSYADLDLSGYYLSDSKKNLKKWQFPEGTFIPAKGFLIIWADEDTTQLGLHANFKLSSEGEVVLMTRPNGIIIDKIEYPAPDSELSYSRVPNGKGSFKWQAPTFGRTNDLE